VAGGGAQAQHDRDRLVVVEQQRRKRRPRAEPVAAGDSRCGLDRVSELAEPGDVPAQGPDRHAQPPGEFRAGPLGAALQDGQQPQQARRRIEHDIQSAAKRGPKLTSIAVNVQT
jgi:hypothetical protein